MKSQNRVDSEAIVRLLLQLAPHTRIVNHVPGEIKLKLDFSGLGLLTDVDFEALLRSVPSISSANTQLLTRSVVISYDPATLPYGLWEALAELRSAPQKAPQVRAKLKQVLDGQAA